MNVNPVLWDYSRAAYPQKVVTTENQKRRYLFFKLRMSWKKRRRDLLCFPW